MLFSFFIFCTRDMYATLRVSVWFWSLFGTLKYFFFGYCCCWNGECRAKDRLLSTSCFVWYSFNDCQFRTLAMCAVLCMFASSTNDLFIFVVVSFFFRVHLSFFFVIPCNNYLSAAAGAVIMPA